MAETYTLYKLIILYMLDKIDFPLTTSQISEFILDKGYRIYILLQAPGDTVRAGGIRSAEGGDDSQPDTVSPD